MKKEELFNIIGEVDEQKVVAAGMAMNTKKKSKPIWVKWGAMAACLCLVAVFTLPFVITSDNDVITSDNENNPPVAPLLPGTEEYHTGKVVEGGNKDVYLSGNAIMEIGFTHAGIQSTDVQNMTLTMDDSGTCVHFDLKFLSLGNWYEYEIDAITGEILTAVVEPSNGNDSPISPVAPNSPSKP